MFRRKDLCPGAEQCPEALTAAQEDGAYGLPCGACPEQLLTEYLASPGGQLILTVLDLDYALQMEIQVPLATIPYHVYLLLRLVAEERSRFHTEQNERNLKRNR